MTVHHKKWILLAALVVLLIVYLILPKDVAVIVMLFTGIPWLALYAIWWRCPYCKRHLGRFQFDNSFCPYCGEELLD